MKIITQGKTTIECDKGDLATANRARNVSQVVKGIIKAEHELANPRRAKIRCLVTDSQWKGIYEAMTHILSWSGKGVGHLKHVDLGKLRKAGGHFKKIFRIVFLKDYYTYEIQFFYNFLYPPRHVARQQPG